LRLLWLVIAIDDCRAEPWWPVSLNGQSLNSRLVSQISSALFTYASRVDALAQDRARSWTKADVTASAAYSRLVWYVSALQMSATTAESEEFAKSSKWLDVYREMHERIATSAKAGDHSGMTRTAEEGRSRCRPDRMPRCSGSRTAVQ